MADDEVLDPKILEVIVKQIEFLNSEIKDITYKINETLKTCDERDEMYGLGKYAKTQQ